MNKILFCILLIFSNLLLSQTRFQLPKDVVFYMELNGRALNNKINWEKLNPIIQEATPKKSDHKMNIWTDFSKTGIKYEATQYHYATFTDSLKTYTTHFSIDNQDKFLEFINSSKKEGQEVVKKEKYSYVNLGNNSFIAWDGKHAILKFLSYTEPYKVSKSTDIDSIVTDSAYVDVATAPEPVAEIEVPEVEFDYKEEVKQLKEDLKYYQENIKTYQAEIARINKDIKYLEKHHKYPVQNKAKIEDTPPVAELPAETPEIAQPDEETLAYENNFKREQDSIKIAEFKIIKQFAEQSFDKIFSSNFQIEVPGDKLKYKDTKADAFFYTDYQNFFQPLNSKKFRDLTRLSGIQGLMSRIIDTENAYNLYFDQDKVRLVNYLSNKNPELQKTISKAYRSKGSKNLAKLVSDNVIGYYGMNLDSEKMFDLFYKFLNVKEGAYHNEINLMVETLKISLDEKALSKIAPGNAVIILDKLSPKKVEYTDFEYDDNYNEKAIKKTKEVTSPSFTFAISTENENYWNKVFTLLSTNEKTSKNIVKEGNTYKWKQDEKSEFDHLYLTVKDGLVVLSSSQETINNIPKTSQGLWAKDLSKHAVSAKLNIQKIITGLSKELKTEKNKDLIKFLEKNMGEFEVKTDAKKDHLETEVNYKTGSTSENSLMYFFDLMDEISKITNQFSPFQKLF